MGAIKSKGNIQKTAITQLCRSEIVQVIFAVIDTGPTKEDAIAATTDFVNHMTLHE